VEADHRVPGLTVTVTVTGVATTWTAPLRSYTF
jgi:hypothetical protein